MVAVTPVALNVGRAEGTAAAKDDLGGIVKVVNVHIGQLHAVSPAGMLGRRVGHACVDQREAVQGEAALHVVGIDADGRIALMVGRIDDAEGNVVGARMQSMSKVAPLLMVVGVVGIARRGRAVVKEGVRGVADKVTIVKDHEAITAAVVISDLEDGRVLIVDQKVAVDRGVGSAKLELCPAAAHIQVNKGVGQVRSSLGSIHILHIGLGASGEAQGGERTEELVHRQ